MMAGRESSYFLHPDGSVESCGRNDEGQLGDGTFVDSLAPVEVDVPNGVEILRLGSGPSSQSAFFVAEEGDVIYAAGQNYRHQLGIGDIGSEVFPVVVDFDEEGSGSAVERRHTINEVSSSGTHTVAISCGIITEEPTASPTTSPTENPTDNPTETPTETPSMFPTVSPTIIPTVNPTEIPTASPSEVGDFRRKGILCAI